MHSSASFVSVRRLKVTFLAFLALITTFVLFTQSDFLARTCKRQKIGFFQLQFFNKRRHEPSRETEQEHFRLHWHRQRKARVDWRAMIKPCFDNMDWGQVKNGWEKHQRTDASKSLIISQDIRPAGQFSRLFIESKTKEGRIKTIGGDSWRVYLRGPASLSATVFDHSNGTYEVLFLVMEPGHYRVETHLDFSLCDGFRDPPENWFRIGSQQGKKQPDGSLGFLDDYMNEPIPGNLSVRIPEPKLNITFQDILLSPMPCQQQCSLLYDGYGRWVNGSWAPFLVDRKFKRSAEEQSHEPIGIILSYGDSLALRFGESMASNVKVLQKYERAEYRYNWIYPVANEAAENSKSNGLDFDGDRVVSYIKQALELPRINTDYSTLVLNQGLHYVVDINFTTYQGLIERVLDLLLINQTIDSPSKAQPRYKTNLIWKTTTQIKKENGKWKNRTEDRFLSEQRVLLFNAYATWRMCKAGIPVLDVLPVTTSYEPGPMDVVHYPNRIFRQAENALADLKTFYKTQTDTNSTHMYRQCIS